jgi:hypothetical protein
MFMSLNSMPSTEAPPVSVDLPVTSKVVCILAAPDTSSVFAFQQDDEKLI